ncbi:uncharacterized protein C8Q71DRAFT_188719 [Rhodofomes roseus]|uniref:F-box domain-containing protein n=1 Tax=Rhodofomes roseus TaxID=34475 RepID=A0ABQ8K8Y7_9APHY|nr:uncharacterized protein C8Q71DRAFT_188719 [Rhodofomes roseus]KAH9833535.1 hypothetical protein C8Q71DRAFT_188719 [Rhodofomes roseus]
MPRNIHKQKETSSSDNGPVDARILMRGRRGGLKDMLKMPLDIIYEICLALHPQDLLSLCRTSKSFHTFLMKRSSVWLWKGSLKKIEGFPACPKGFIEPSWISLVFWPICTRCRKADAPTVHWEFLARWCKKCTKEMVIAENRTDKILNEYLALDFDKIPRDVFLSAKIPGIGVPCYLQDEVHHIAHAFWKLHKWQKDEAAALADKYTRRANRHREYASLCKKWADNEERMQSEERKAMVLKRLEDTVSRLRTLGWDKELDFIQARQYKPLSDHKFVRVGKRLSDQVWQKNEEEMVHLMKNVRNERLEHDYTVVLSERWHVLESVVKEFLDQYLCDHPEILDYGFNIADLALTREYREVMCVPADQVVDRATFLALKGKTDTIVRRWRNNVRKHFHGLFAQYDVGTRNHSDPLDLATTLFIDLRSGQRVFFPQVVARNSRLATSKDGRDAYEKFVYGLKDIHCSVICSMLRPLQPTGVEIMQEVIQLCGKDPATATAKAMDTLDVRLVDDFAGKFVTWRGAVTEASRGGAQKWRLVSRHEMAKVKQHEMFVLNKEKLWACARCEARRLPVTREVVWAHLCTE